MVILNLKDFQHYVENSKKFFKEIKNSGYKNSFIFSEEKGLMYFTNGISFIALRVEVPAKTECKNSYSIALVAFENFLKKFKTFLKKNSNTHYVLIEAESENKGSLTLMDCSLKDTLYKQSVELSEYDLPVAFLAQAYQFEKSYLDIMLNVNQLETLCKMSKTGKNGFVHFFLKKSDVLDSFKKLENENNASDSFCSYYSSNVLVAFTNEKNVDKESGEFFEEDFALLKPCRFVDGLVSNMSKVLKNIFKFLPKKIYEA